MNYEIEKEKWTEFFDTVSKRRFAWITRVEVLSPEMGDQMLTDGLPLNGITVETIGDRMSIEISVGDNDGTHQTHSINDPSSVAFLSGDQGHVDVLDIEEKDGTKTLVSFIEPMGILVGFIEVEILASSA